MRLKRPSFSNKGITQELVGFDLNDENLKIAHVHVSSLKREAQHLASREVRGVSEDELAAFIRQTLSAWQVKNPSAFITVPMHLVITRSIEIPSKDPDEIREIVSLQASRHTPYARSEIIIDTLILGIVRESYTKVLLVIVPKDVIARQTRILEKAGLGLSKIFFPPEAITQACSKILGNEAGDSPVAIVHMDSFFTSFVVSHKTKILFVRGIAIGAQHLLEEKEVYSDRFVDELQRSLESYIGEEVGGLPALLLLTGVVAETTDLDDLFSQTLNMPIKHQTYFNHFSISNEARAVAAASQRISYFNLVAPLLLYDRMKMDLTSDERKLKIQLESRARQMIKTGVLAMMLLVLIFVSFVSKVYFKKAYLAELKSRYAPVRNEAKSLERLFVKTRFVKETLASRGESIETLTRLYDTLPKDVRVTQIRYEEGSKFTVKGTSAAMASVFSFVGNLERSGKFKSVKTKYVTNRSEGDADVADFEINCLIREGVKAL